MNNFVNVEMAGINDIDALVKMRLEYLIEDNSGTENVCRRKPGRNYIL